jgi:PAS domain S-box-containing protein
MTEITRVQLENEMDLILGHKQSMKLAELCGFGLPAQTNLATAVSELSRAALECGCEAKLLLHVSSPGAFPKALTVQIHLDLNCTLSAAHDGFRYAQRLISNVSLRKADESFLAQLSINMPQTTRIDDAITDRWRRFMNTDPDVSPYEEIKRKNRQLQDLASKLSESEEKYRELTNSLPIIICTLDASGNLLYGNQWLNDYSGSTLDAINDSRWVDLLEPSEYELVVSNNRRLSTGDYQRELEYRLRDKNGAYRWHMGRITPIVDGAGEPKFWSLFLADIHAQKEVKAVLKDNDELRQTKALLEQKVQALDISNKQLEQFAYIASHDLQEPLRKIIYFSDFLLSQHADALNQDGRDILGRMGAATSRMKMLISDVLAYSRLPDENRHWERVSLNLVAKEAAQNLEFQVAEKTANVHFDELPEIDGIHVQLRQLFENLIGNSLKYSDTGRSPEIRISVTAAEDMITMRFEDNGIGFENEYVPKMFGMFQRLHGRDKYSGTGIGLSLCQKIVELHGGRIHAEGVLNEGAIFTVMLPAVQLQLPVAQVAAGSVSGADVPVA